MGRTRWLDRLGRPLRHLIELIDESSGGWRECAGLDIRAV